MPTYNDQLPCLLILLHDTARMLREECPESGRAIYKQIEQWEQSLLTQLVKIDSSITDEKLMARCRQAPPQMLLQALIAQQEALRTLSENDYQASLRGLSAEDDAFWNEEGDGYWAIEYGKSALASTWWVFHEQIRQWAASNAATIEQVIKQASHLLSEEASRQQIGGVFEPILQRLATYKQELLGDDTRRETSTRAVVLSSVREKAEIAHQGHCARRQRVFLCTNHFTQYRRYYVVAPSEDEAHDKARNESFPEYLGDVATDTEYEHCTVDEELDTLLLEKIESALLPPTHIHLLIFRENDTTWTGYLIYDEKVELVKRTYTKSQWRIIEDGNSDDQKEEE